jgi:hypothetical protein
MSPPLPLPWDIDQFHDFRDANGSRVNVYSHAALIVRAVNSHADLLAALKAMVDRWEPDRGGTDRCMWEEAVSAIAKAEGTTP